MNVSEEQKEIWAELLAEVYEHERQESIDRAKAAKEQERTKRELWIRSVEALERIANILEGDNK